MDNPASECPLIQLDVHGPLVELIMETEPDFEGMYRLTLYRRGVPGQAYTLAELFHISNALQSIVIKAHFRKAEHQCQNTNGQRPPEKP